MCLIYLQFDRTILFEKTAIIHYETDSETYSRDEFFAARWSGIGVREDVGSTACKVIEVRINGFPGGLALGFRPAE